MNTDVQDGTRYDEHTVLPPRDMAEMMRLASFLKQHNEPAGLVGPDGEQVPLPLEVYEVLVQVVAAMKAGKAIAVAPLEQRLTTQQAADLLGISRPTLVKLLDEHEIPYEQPGRHRRVRLSDVLAYRDRRRQERRARLDDMTRQAVEDGLYDVPSEAYAQALRKARGKPTD
ncbi:helix-turn-helix domain-containing protein [Phytoactinopolyspora limicola]|uniref:helix-turn-helix domain-containing protein n=1 Tax=Phytoactinopolyspora limicola TaxID=2715536 RepID=UPI0014097E02|nr:helix-turn-helix domain-containing protein [Phytoactinopolyspora limicola]